MAQIIYKPLSSLAPIEIKYEYFNSENLQAKVNSYQNGLTVYSLQGLSNFQDVVINKHSCLVLTSAVYLDSLFTPAENISINKLPTSILLQHRDSSIYYIQHQSSTNTFKQALSSFSTFFIQPISNTNEFEIFVDNKYLQIAEEYPYVAFLGNNTLNPEDIHRQRFQIVQQGNLITFKTLTNAGYRYLSITSDNVLRATGVLLNETVVNDYIFKCIPITVTELKKGFDATNRWTTYFYDFENGAENKTLAINKSIDTPTNFLLDFPINNAATTGIAQINIANLKTSVTPVGTPATVDNSYNKTVITSN